MDAVFCSAEAAPGRACPTAESLSAAQLQRRRERFRARPLQLLNACRAADAAATPTGALSAAAGAAPCHVWRVAYDASGARAAATLERCTLDEVLRAPRDAGARAEWSRYLQWRELPLFGSQRR